MKRKTAYTVDTCYLFVVALELPGEPVVDADHFTFEAHFCKHPVTARCVGNTVPGRVEWQEQASHSVESAEPRQNSEHFPPIPVFRGSANESRMLGIQNTDLGEV